MATTRRRSIVGLTWKRLTNNNLAVVDENEHSKSPVTRSMSGGSRKPLGENINREKTLNSGAKDEQQDGKKKAILRRVSSVRDAFGTLRQRMKLSSTRRRTRLLNQSPYCETPAARTPASQHKKRFSNLPAHIQEEVKMYSPFQIESPDTRRSPRTPRSIRMGVHTPKSIDFSTPNTRFKKDLDAVSQGLEDLRGMGRSFGSVIKRQNSQRTTKEK